MIFHMDHTLLGLDNLNPMTASILSGEEWKAIGSKTLFQYFLGNINIICKFSHTLTKDIEFQRGCYLGFKVHAWG